MSKLTELQNAVYELSKIINESDYRMMHQAPGKDSAPLYDLTLNGVYPKDVYSTLEHYVDGADYDYESLAKIRMFKNKPESWVTIYRAVPVAVAKNHKKQSNKWLKDPSTVGTTRPQIIHPGDWVTLSQKYAKLHALDLEGRNKHGKVVSKKVKAKQIFTDGNSINEWGYNP